MAQWAADPDQPWTELAFDQFGLHAVLQVKIQQALYYKAGGQRLLSIVLVHDLQGQRPDQMFYCTKLDWDARQILSTYACRWAIECTFENCKQFLGLEDPANRLPKAVQRTAPMALVLYTLIILWFHQSGSRRIGTVLAGTVCRTFPYLKPVKAGSLRAKSALIKLPLAPITAADIANAKDVAKQVREPKIPFLETVNAFQVLDVAAREGKPWEVEVQAITLGDQVGVFTGRDLR
jgi:hypothetical protein